MKKVGSWIFCWCANYGRQAKVPCIDLWTFGSQIHGCIVLRGIFRGHYFPVGFFKAIILYATKEMTHKKWHRLESIPYFFWHSICYIAILKSASNKSILILLRPKQPLSPPFRWTPVFPGPFKRSRLLAEFARETSRFPARKFRGTCHFHLHFFSPSNCWGFQEIFRP